MNFVAVPGHWGTLPLSMKGALNDNIEEHIPTILRQAPLIGFMEPGATQGSVANELGITGTQLMSWRQVVLFRLRSGLPTHLCSPSFKGQGAFSTQ